MPVIVFLMVVGGWLGLGVESAMAQPCGGGNGTCSTIADCTGTATPDPAMCGSLTCCVGGSNPNPNPGSGSSCSDATKYEMIAGVCFPKTTGLPDKTVLEIITALMSWLLGIFGVLALIGFIISGIQYLVSAGDEHMAETAKRNMKYAIIGVIVALSGYVMIQAIDTLLKADPFI